LYREARSKTRALVDLIGAFVFLLPVALMILLVSLPYVANAWAVLEGSSEGRLGIPAIFLLKTTMPLFANLLGQQGLSMAIHAALRLSGLAGLDDLDHFVGDIDPETRP
jgi:TRAP-type mannitol/chloroaromatic compound transport system permease small subunit